VNDGSDPTGERAKGTYGVHRETTTTTTTRRVPFVASRDVI